MSAAQLTAGRGGPTNGPGRGRGTGRGAGRGTGQSNQFFGLIRSLGVFETADERTRHGRGQNQFIDTLKTLSTHAAQKLNTKEGKTNIRNLIRDLEPFAPTVPVRPPKGPPTLNEAGAVVALGTYDPHDYQEYSDDKKKFDLVQDAFMEGQTNMWSVIWNQASRKMQSEVEATTGYDAMVANSDILALLKAIKIVSYKFDHQSTDTRRLPSVWLSKSYSTSAKGRCPSMTTGKSSNRVAT
jgi:hypothetical protein